MLREEKKRERKEVRITVPGWEIYRKTIHFSLKLWVFFYIITRPEILISIGQQDTHTPKNESIFQKLFTNTIDYTIFLCL